MNYPELMFEANDKVGEGPSWNTDDGKIYWVDIPGKRIHSLDPLTKADDPIPTEDIVCAMVFDKSKNIVAALSDRLVRIDPKTKRANPLMKFDGMHKNVRLNDGKCDAAGRLWIGTMDLDEKEKIGCLYCVSPDLSFKKVLDGLIISNGMAWSADNKIFYFIDTPTKEVWAFDFDLAKGELSGKRVVFKFPEGVGAPDGMTIDDEGMLWVAHFRGAQVSRWNPRTGEKIASYPVPTYNVTCPCFGGAHMDELFVTTASILMEGSTDEQKIHAGALYRMKAGVTGKEAFKFGG